MYKKKTSIIGIIITIIILIILVFVSNLNVENLSYIENVVSTIVMPIQNGLTYIKNKITGNSTFFSDISKLQQENEELRKKNSELETTLREFEIVKSENTTLKEYLNLSEQYANYQTKPAYIIAKDITNYSKVFTINIGKKDGIENNMTVISEKGLVGHVIQVTEHTAKVQTIIDTASTVSTTITTSRDNIICKGTIEHQGKLKASLIPTNANLIIGDVVETSRNGRNIPKRDKNRNNKNNRKHKRHSIQNSNNRTSSKFR